MPEERMTEQEAVAALSAAAVEDGHENSTERVYREAREEVQADSAASGEQADAPAPEGQVEEGTTEEDSFSRLDPNSIPEEMQPWYKSMQADYTRSKQKIAEQASQFEALEQYGGVDVATQALDWIASLQNPENQLALHRDLTEALTEAGVPLEVAEVEAGRRVEQARQAEVDDFEDPDSQALQEVSSKLASMEQRLAERDEQDRQMRLTAEMDRQEAEILRDHPEYGEEAIEHIYNLAYSTGGNLLKAEALYQDIQGQILGDYISKKGTVKSGVSGVPATVAADIPQTVTDLNDPQLERAVARYIAESMSDS